MTTKPKEMLFNFLWKMAIAKDDFEYSNFKTLIESVCDMEPLQFKKQITIYSNLDDISIYMNVGLMAIAVKNIINNAMKYSKNTSSIKL